MTVSQVTVPQEFFDITSAGLLVEPRPEFLYAKMILKALGTGGLAGVDAPLGHPGRELSGVNASYGPLEGDALILSDSFMGEVFRTPVEGNFRGLPGATVRFNRPKYDTTVYTEASREVGANQSISTTPMTISSAQASMTLKRYSGPCDPTTSRPAPYGIDALSASLGVHSLSSMVGGHLTYDYHKFLETRGVALLDGGDVIYPNTGITANDDIVQDGVWITLEQIMRTEQSMDDDNLPAFADGYRLLVLPPAAKAQLAQDRDYQRSAQFVPTMNAILPGYFGTVGKFHILRSTTLTNSTNTSSKKVYYGHAIAPGVAGVGVGNTPRVAYSNDDNYGETAKVIWVAYHAFATLDKRFVRSVRFGQ